MQRSLVVDNALRELRDLIKHLVDENVKCHKYIGTAKSAEKYPNSYSPLKKDCLESLSLQASYVESAVEKVDLLIQGNNPDMSEVGISVRRSTLFALLRDHADRLPVFQGEDEKAPVLCGNVKPDEKHRGRIGDHVAARIPSCEGSSQWILGVVQTHNGCTGRYAVQDIEREDAMYYLQRRHLTFLPVHKVDPTQNPGLLYGLGRSVLALYPHTTCFYPGVVHSQPKNIYDDYHVKFEDNHYEGGYSQPVAVAQRYILPPTKKSHASVSQES